MGIKVECVAEHHTFTTEQALLANVRDRGLVVMTPCSHRGIMRIAKNGARTTGVQRVRTIGSFHLSRLSDERVPRGVDQFRNVGVDHVVPQHCTGIEAIATLYAPMPKQLVVPSVETSLRSATDASGTLIFED